MPSDWQYELLHEELGTIHKINTGNNLQNVDYLVVGFDVSLFINVPVEEVLQVIRNSSIQILLCQNTHQVKEVMELLDICLNTTYFQFEDEFCQQKEGIAMGN
jgi:hypothetical protein